jgi:uncharacterized protein involved in copper resistance
MFSTRHRQRVTAWIAFFAIMLASLMPTVSRAMAAAASDSSTQVCSTSHHDAMPAAGHHAPAPEHGALHLDHCAFCLTHAGSFGLPATVAVALPILAGPAVHPAPIFQSRRALVAWTTAQSRAPPLAS